MAARPDWTSWRPVLDELYERIAATVRDARAREAQELARPLRRGAGDTTFWIDDRAESAVDLWLEETARTRPLSLLTEDAGWRHAGPGQPRDFDHGGPRIALDPIDGTRVLMTDLRSAWTVIGLCPPGPTCPRLDDVRWGLVGELPDSRAAVRRVLTGGADQPARIETRDLNGAAQGSHPLEAGPGDQADHGFLPFFRYSPRQRPALARIEAEFFARLERDEGADPDTLWDDQYLSNAGQLVLVTLGTYRMVADLRAWLAERTGTPAVTTKPYDVSGAIAVARAAGAVVQAPQGGPLDAPLDTSTPVSFAAFANRATARRLGPHLAAALQTAGGAPTPRRSQ